MPLKLLKNNKTRLLSSLTRLTFLVFALSSCSLWERLGQSNNLPSTSLQSIEDCNTSSRNSGSNFIVGQVEAGVGVSAITLSYTGGLISEFKLNLKARLTDVLDTDLPIQYASFDIEYYPNAQARDNNKPTTVSVPSDSNGYIQWEEVYDYRYKKRPSWIVLERTIKGGVNNARYQGAEIIPMGVNPWLSARDKDNGEPLILDIRCEHFGTSDRRKEFIEEDGLDYLSETKEEERPLLFAPVVEIQVEETIRDAESKLETEYNKQKQNKENSIEKLKSFGLANLLLLSKKELKDKEKELREEVIALGHNNLLSLSIEELENKEIQVSSALINRGNQNLTSKLEELKPPFEKLEEYLERLENYLQEENQEKKLNPEELKLLSTYIAIKKAQGKELIRRYMEAKNNEKKALGHFLRSLQNTCTLPEQKECYKRHFNISFVIKLQYRYFDRSDVTEEELNGGSYNIESQLLISSVDDTRNGKEYYELHNECKQLNVKKDPAVEFLHFSCDITMSGFDQNSKYNLSLEIKPYNLPFMGFQGIYTIEDLSFQNVKNIASLDSRYDGNYKEALEQNKPLTIIESLKAQPILSLMHKQEKQKTQPNVEIQVDEGDSRYQHHVNEPQPLDGVLDIHSLQLDGDGDYKLSHIETGECTGKKENVVTRTVVFIGKVCLTDVLGRHKLKKTSLQVFLEKETIGAELAIEDSDYSLEEIFFTDENGKKKYYTTNNDSCLSIPIELKHKIYNIQRYHSVKVHVYSKKLNLYGQVSLALSPWQRAFQAFQDAQNLPSGAIRYDIENTDPPELVINQFRSIHLVPSYGLDKLLNIHLFHRIYFLFQPFIRRPDNLALGLQHHSRELLRDGYYLVRVLLLRNPQETGITPRVQHVENQNQSRKSPNNEDESQIDITGMEYITHTDSVAKAEANFMNFYMPLYLSTQHFLYIASRNYIVVEIYPADPSGLRYHDDCTLDLDKTIWKKFDDHDLINKPYVGPMNVQNWVNWNLLQPAKGESTDSIINRSKIGRKYKHFDFSPTNENTNTNPQEETLALVDETQQITVKEASAQNLQQNDRKPDHTLLNSVCVGGYITADEQKEEVHELLSGSEPEEWDLSEYYNEKQEVKNCDNRTSSTAMSSVIEHAQKVVDDIEEFDILKNFAEDNSLKLVNFEKDKKLGDTFIEDMNKAFNELKSFLHESSISFFNRSKKTYFGMLTDLFPHDSIDFALLRKQFLAFCPRSKGISLPQNTNITRACEKEILTSYFTTVSRLSIKPDPLFHFFDIAKNMELIEQDVWTNQPEECKEFQSYFSCYQNAQDTIFEIMKQAFDRSLKNRYFLQEMLLHLLSSKGKEQLLHTFQSDCYQRVFQTSLQAETCYYNKILELLNESSHYQHNTADFVAHNNQYNLVNFYAVATRNNIALLTQMGWDDILKGILDLPQNFSSKQENIYPLIDEGIKTTNQNTSQVLAFTKSLCFFWMDSYIKKYLGTEQMVQAYTNFVKKFDYLQMDEDNIYPKPEEEEQVTSFWDDLPEFLSIALNPKKEENLFTILGDDTNDSVSCYKGYAQCVVLDYCSDEKQNEYCKKLGLGENLEDSICPILLQEKCDKNSNHRFCKEDGRSCNNKARAYCQTNRNQEFCKKYNNRCASGYLKCIARNKNSPLFNVDKALNYDSEKKRIFPPLETCLENPLEFFQFENKMIVHDISKKEDPKYEGGFLRHFFVSANHSIGSYMNWTAQRGVGVSSGAKVSASLGSSFPGADKIKGIWRFLRLAFGGELSVGVSQSVNSNTSKSGRRAIDGRAGEGLFLGVGQATISVGVTKFQNCLVVKPRPNAFTAKFEQGLPVLYENVWSEDAQNNSFKKVLLSRPGLMLCNPIETRESRPKYISEHYYYISHLVAAENSQFLNLYDLANRPFAIILRGSKEFAKLYYMLRGGLDGKDVSQRTADEEKYTGKLNIVPPSMFEDYPWPIDKAIGLALDIREFNETGFHPGVYHYPYNEKPLSATFTQDETNWTLKLLENNHVFFPKVPNSPTGTIAVESQ